MNALLKFFFVIIFFLIITPIGLVIRLLGIDLLKKKINANQNSYWTKHINSK